MLTPAATVSHRDGPHTHNPTKVPFVRTYRTKVPFVRTYRTKVPFVRTNRAQSGPDAG